MSIPEELTVFVLAIASCVAGIVLIAVGFGLAMIPASIPIFGAAANSVSSLYVLSGIALIILGGGALILLVSDVLSAVRPGNRRSSR